MNTTETMRYVQTLELPAALRGMDGLEAAVPEFTATPKLTPQ